ncbi:hypothetical protein [Pyxidicoccus sp. MSG2]|uniref:hypothetical protein n=1 Tax=Pyxidicoccus sp. MSG2 TaxID=2996790 RepID=UPI00227133DF|nr:hypothetical protein [Pyxidicoccus sp. MSG2]MCY1022577.1 hypothetical protein [Pyxidicoccus sp. MSG2]
MKKATEFVPPTQEEVGADLRALFRQAIRMTLTTLLEEEVELLVGAGRFARFDILDGYTEM